MNKTTIELHRKRDTTFFVSHFGIPYGQDNQATLDRLIEWAQEPANLGRKVYRHIVYSVDENVRDEPHTWSEGGYVYPKKCDHVTYLDIYWQ